MDTYTMTQVETLTGINAHTLRIWEKRYSFIEAYRSETNIRYYSGEQLKQLLNIAILTRNGYRISKIDAMSKEEIIDTVTNLLIEPNDKIDDEINSLILAMLNFDEAEFNKIYQRNILRKGILKTIIEIFYPFLNHVGVLWGTNKLTPPQEHFISNLIRQKIISAIELLPLPLNNSPTLILFLLENEEHELSLLLSNYIAKDLGWKVIYLGQRMPIDNLEAVITETQPSFLMTMLTTPRADNFIEILALISEKTKKPILFSGNPTNIDNLKTKNHLYYLKSPEAFVNFLNQQKPSKEII